MFEKLLIIYRTSITMDSLDLLAREDEFKKLNKQLEKKTESLMKEIEYVMQKQDFFTEFSHTLSPNVNKNNHRKHSCDSQNQAPQQNSTPTKSILRRSSKPTKNGQLQSEINSKIGNLNQNCIANNTHIHNIDITNNHIGCASNSTGCPSNCTGWPSNNTGCSNNCSGWPSNNTGCSNNCTDCTNHTNQMACDCDSLNKSKRNDDVEFLHAFVSVNVQEKVLPQSFLKDNISIESICKFLSSKIKLMQEQMDKLQSTLDSKAAQCKIHLTVQAELEGERMSLLNNSQNCRAAAADARAKCTAMENKLNEKDRLYKEQRSEADKLLSEVKRLRSKNANLEAKCSTQEETIENQKQQLDVAKRSEKEFRDSSRNLSASHQNAICRLEERVKLLTACIEKQKSLIDNLRRQNAILLTEGAVKALEREYCNFLTQE
ncbi:uncharacterized protein LOC131855322 [Achroia grisella]|uniref:uncharacterized protein LOC131855322 n=1 Tax=Achroia grisella TaxID=688607 RepID=UPI0027D235A0|nr:uncharacterized protein LOC131855322 [Achroia grisella]